MTNYEKEYIKWINSLSPAERQSLKDKGLDKPEIDHNKIFKINPEPVFAQMSIFDEIEKNIDDEVEVNKPNELIYMLSYILSRIESLLDKDTLIVALGLGLFSNATQTELALKHGITRSMFSLKVKEWQLTLGLTPSHLMRSQQVCKLHHNIKSNEQHRTRKTI